MNQYDTFTKTDRIINIIVLTLVIAISIYGYFKKSNMTDSIQGAIVGGCLAIIGSTIPILTTFLKKRNQEKKIMSNIQISLIDIFENVYLDGITRLEKDYAKLKKSIESKNESTYFVVDTTFLTIGLFEILDKNSIIKVFVKHNIELNKLFYFITYTKIVLDNSPSSIIEKYHDFVTSEMEETEKSVEYINKNSSLFENNPTKFTALRLQRRDEILESYKDSFIESCDYYNEIVLTYKNLITYFIKELK